MHGFGSGRPGIESLAGMADSADAVGTAVVAGTPGTDGRAPAACESAVPRFVLALVLFAMGCGGSAATVEPAPTPEPEQVEHVPPAAEPELRRPFLYRVEPATPSAPSYLFGTIHAGVGLDDALPLRHRPALDRARVVVAEMDPQAVDPAQAMAGTRLPPGETLDALLGAELWPLLVRQLGAAIPPRALVELRPWVPMALLIQQRMAALSETTVGAPMDVIIVGQVRTQGASLVFLESGTEQMALMNAVPSETYVHFLREMLEDEERTGENLGGLLTAYVQGNEEGMVPLLFVPEDVTAQPAFYEKLFFARNEAWLPRIAAEIDQGGTFVAVGLGHLLGERGLIALLTARGYRIERVAE